MRVRALALGLLLAAPALGQGPHVYVKARLQTKLDARHSKPGDAITAELLTDVEINGRVLLSKGTRLGGVITEVSAAENNRSPSEVGAKFDRAEPRQGSEIPLQAAIVRVLSSDYDPATRATLDDMNQPGGSIVGNQLIHPSPSADIVANVGVPDSNRPLDQQAVYDSNGTPVGMKFLPARVADGKRSDMGTAIVAAHGDLHLDSGAEVQIEVIAIGSANPG